MASITTRAGKGTALTTAEVDANFTNLNTELGTKLALTGGVLTGNATVNAGTDSRFLLQVSGTTQAQFQATASAVRVASNNAIPLILATNGVDRVAIDSNGNVTFGSATASASYKFQGTNLGDLAVFESVDGAASAAPDVVLYRNSASPAAADQVGNFIFRGKNSAAADTSYARIISTIISPTSGAETGDLRFGVKTAAGFLDLMTLASAGLAVTGAVSATSFSGSASGLTGLKTVNGSSILGAGDIQMAGDVTSFNTRTGAISLSSLDVTGALGFTPYSDANPTGYVTSSALSDYLTSATAASTYLPLAGGVVTGALTVTDTLFTIKDDADPTKTGQFNLANVTTGTAYTWSLPALTGTLATIGALGQTFTGTTTFSGGTISLTSATQVLNLGTSNTTGVLTLGGTAGTGIITLGRSTGTQVMNIQSGATASAATKTLAIGTGGLTGSTTAISIGSTFGTSVTANGTWTFGTAIAGSVTGTAATITGVYGGTITSSQVTTGLGFTPYNATNPSGYITSSGSISGSAGSVSASADQAIVNQHNGNAGQWYGRIVSKNSTNDKAAFLGTYGTLAGVFAHNNALNAWADLYVNTVDGSTGGTVRLPLLTLVGGNQVLHAGNYNSYAPTLTGTGASGTWGISVTGNAATATTASNLTNFTASSVSNAITADSPPTVDTIGYCAQAGLPFSQADGGLYTAGYSTAWYHQIYGDFRSGQIAVRGKNSGTWQAWRSVLDSSNYNSYSPTLTGGNASGTWSISVTGNAATATSATYLNSSNYINQTGSTGSWNADFQNTPAGTARYSGDVGANGTSNPGGTWWIQQNFRHTNTSNYWGTQVAWGWEDNANRLATRNVTAGSFGAWVYYLNSNNYNQYSPTLTGTGASGTWGISVTGNAATASNVSSISNAVGGSYTWTGANTFFANQNTASGSSPPLQVYGTTSGAMMAFHRGGYYAVNMGLDSDNVMRIGGWSAAANRWQLDMSGNGTYAGNVTAYSDERLKKDWTPLVSDFVEKLAAVKAGTYTRIDSGERQAGSSAQDWQELLPEVVTEGADEAKTLALAYGNAALVSVIELAKRVIQLERRLAALEK